MAKPYAQSRPPRKPRRDFVWIASFEDRQRLVRKPHYDALDRRHALVA